MSGEESARERWAAWEEGQGGGEKSSGSKAKGASKEGKGEKKAKGEKKPKEPKAEKPKEAPKAAEKAEPAHVTAARTNREAAAHEEEATRLGRQARQEERLGNRDKAAKLDAEAKTAGEKASALREANKGHEERAAQEFRDKVKAGVEDTSDANLSHEERKARHDTERARANELRKSVGEASKAAGISQKRVGDQWVGDPVKERAAAEAAHKAADEIEKHINPVGHESKVERMQAEQSKQKDVENLRRIAHNHEAAAKKAEGASAASSAPAKTALETWSEKEGMTAEQGEALSRAALKGHSLSPAEREKAKAYTAAFNKTAADSRAARKSGAANKTGQTVIGRSGATGQKWTGKVGPSGKVIGKTFWRCERPRRRSCATTASARRSPRNTPGRSGRGECWSARRAIC